MAVPKFVEERRRGFSSVRSPGGGVEAPFAAVHPPHAASGVTASLRSLASLSTAAATHRHYFRSLSGDGFLTIILKAILILIFHLQEAKRLILMHLKILFNEATIWHEQRAMGSV